MTALHSALVGACAPDFTLPDPATGTSVSLADFDGQDVLLVFFRGTWCPFCREQMRVLSEQEARLRAAKTVVLGIVCQNAASVGRYAREHSLPFPLLADEKRTVAKAYGVHYWLSAEGFNLAQPALFVVDRGGVITFGYVGRGMRDLPITTVLERFVKFLDTSGEGTNPA